MTYGRWLTLTGTLLLLALVSSLGLVALAASAARSAEFPLRMTSPFSRVMDYPFELQHVDCEIVVFGDSSALTSEDPRVLEAQTRLKTCNIAQPAPNLAITGTLVVDEYLKRNQAPKVLLIQLAPETFYMSHRLDKVTAFDPITLLLRRGTTAEAVKTLSWYPQQTLRYASIVLQDRYKPGHAALSRFSLTYAEKIRQFHESRGLMTLATPTETMCVPPRSFEGPPDFSWLDAARKRYEARGTKVLAMVSPIPTCDTQASKYSAELSSHVDIVSWTMPLDLFNDGDRHFTLEGAQQVSTVVGKRIAELARRNDRTETMR